MLSCDDCGREFDTIDLQNETRPWYKFLDPNKGACYLCPGCFDRSVQTSIEPPMPQFFLVSYAWLTEEGITRYENEVITEVPSQWLVRKWKQYPLERTRLIWAMEISEEEFTAFERREVL